MSLKHTNEQTKRAILESSSTTTTTTTTTNHQSANLTDLTINNHIPTFLTSPCPPTFHPTLLCTPPTSINACLSLYNNGKKKQHTNETPVPVIDD
jgi:hypothetical protein